MTKKERLVKVQEIIVQLRAIELELMELSEWDDAEESISGPMQDVRSAFEALQGYRG